MEDCPVALMLAEPVLRIAGVEFQHNVVTCNLGRD
jgi:hypothetical protein